MSQNQEQPDTQSGQEPNQTQPVVSGQPVIPEMTGMEKKIVAILGNRLGRENAIKMAELAEIIDTTERDIRQQINNLKFIHHIPILSWDHPKFGGYYLATDQDDHALCIQMFMSRIWTSLKNVATLKGISMIEAGEYFAIELTKMTEDEQKKEFMKGLPEPPPNYSLVTALAKNVQGNPEKYRRDLHNLQNLFGAKFIQRNKLKELANIREKLNFICTDLEG